jgi:hypothetical protein
MADHETAMKAEGSGLVPSRLLAIASLYEQQEHGKPRGQAKLLTTVNSGLIVRSLPVGRIVKTVRSQPT